MSKDLELIGYTVVHQLKETDILFVQVPEDVKSDQVRSICDHLKRELNHKRIVVCNRDLELKIVSQTPQERDEWGRGSQLL